MSIHGYSSSARYQYTVGWKCDWNRRTQLRHKPRVTFKDPIAVERRLGHQNKRTHLSHTIRLLPWQTPIHLPSKSNEESQTKTPTLKISRSRINKLSDATPASLSVTRASQGKGAIRDFDAFNPPHKAQHMRKWRTINKDKTTCTAMHVNSWLRTHFQLHNPLSLKTSPTQHHKETGSNSDGELPTTMPE